MQEDILKIEFIRYFNKPNYIAVIIETPQGSQEYAICFEEDNQDVSDLTRIGFELDKILPRAKIIDAK